MSHIGCMEMFRVKLADKCFDTGLLTSDKGELIFRRSVVHGIKKDALCCIHLRGTPMPEQVYTHRERPNMGANS